MAFSLRQTTSDSTSPATIRQNAQFMLATSSGDETLGEIRHMVNQNVGRKLAKGFGLKAPRHPAGGDTGVARGLNVNPGIAHHPRILRWRVHLRSQRLDPDRMRLLVIEAVAAVDAEKQRRKAETLHNPLTDANRLVRQDSEPRTARMQPMERITDLRIKNRVIERMVAVVVEEKLECVRYFLFRRLGPHG